MCRCEGRSGGKVGGVCRCGGTGVCVGAGGKAGVCGGTGVKTGVGNRCVCVCVCRCGKAGVCVWGQVCVVCVCAGMKADVGGRWMVCAGVGGQVCVCVPMWEGRCVCEGTGVWCVQVWGQEWAVVGADGALSPEALPLPPRRWSPTETPRRPCCASRTSSRCQRASMGLSTTSTGL